MIPEHDLSSLDSGHFDSLTVGQSATERSVPSCISNLLMKSWIMRDPGAECPRLSRYVRA